MARIRTVKPEFWTDSKIVRLPIHVRLFFIGLWQLADDWGALEDEPERLKLSIFPADDVDPDECVDILEQEGLVERFLDEKGVRVIYIPNFCKHQKIDKRAARRFSGGKWRKSAVPANVRREVAKIFNCTPGGAVPADCYYCGQPSHITWMAARRTGAMGWITFGCLELDHFVPEIDGGLTAAGNIVLACRKCNRQKGAYEHGYSFAANKLQQKGPILHNAYPDIDRDSATDPYSGKTHPPVPRRTEVIPPNPAESRQGVPENGLGTGNREQGIEQGKNTITDPQAESVPRRVRQEYPEDFERTWETYPKRNGDNPKRSALKAWSARRKAGHTAEVIHAGVERYRRWCEATGKINTETVKQAATFFGPDESFLLPWDIPAAKPVNGYPRTDADWMSKGRQLGIHAKPGESMPAYIGRLKSAMEGAHGNA